MTSSGGEPGAQDPAILDEPDVRLGKVLSTTPIEEDAAAGSRLTPPSVTPTPEREKTRTKIAWTMVIALLVLVAVGAVGWLCHGNDVERMQSFAIVFSPIVTLVGTVLGFYFSASND